MNSQVYFFLPKRHIIHISAKSTKGGVLGPNFRIVHSSYSSLSDFLTQKILVRPNYHFLKLALLYLQIARMDWESASSRSSSSAHHSSSCRAFPAGSGDPYMKTWNLFPALVQSEQKPSHNPTEPPLFCYRTFASSLPQTEYKNITTFISIKILNFRR